jgi:serine/threonine protein kinase
MYKPKGQSGEEMPLQDSFSRKSDNQDPTVPRTPRPAKWPRVPTLEDLEFSYQRAKDSPEIPAAMLWKRTESSNFVISVTFEKGTNAGEATWVMQAEEMGDNVVLWSFRSREAQVIHQLMEEAITSLEPGNQPDYSISTSGSGLKPGTIIDHYEVREEIGSGGMGVVYKGRDQMFDRTVALKVLHGKLLSDPLSKKRFEQEGRATITLVHPNLISVYHYGFSSSGHPFIVMEHVDGRGLDKLLEIIKHLDVEEFVDIFLQACDALSHAHDRGIIHRDLKPSNLMIVETGRKKERMVKIVDFGISKILPHGRFPGQDLTSAGDVVGSPLYMSPEQCKGLSLDGRSDIYSLGCLMYQSVSGALPFLGENALQTLSKHICDPPPPFDEVVPSLNIPKQLQDIIFKALEKEPENRYSTVGELRADLDAFNPKSKSLSLTTTTLTKVTSSATAGSVQILMEAGELPRATLEASVNVQKLIKEGKVTLSQAADLLQRAHKNDGKIDFDKISPQGNTHSFVVDTPLEAVLVEAGLISNAVWRTLLQLQAAIRNQEMTKEDAVEEFKKRHPRATEEAKHRAAKEASAERSKKAEMSPPINVVDLLKQAGIVTQEDIENATKLDQDKGAKIEKHLVAMGKIDTKTVLASYQCMTMLTQKRLEVGQAIIALNFCQRSRVDFGEAMKELGWELSS